MTSNDKEAEKNQEFVFGEYVSPNPKSISLGVKLRPDPLISYKTDKTVKTECKPIQQQRKELIDNEKKNEFDGNDNDNDNNNDNNNKNTEIAQITKSKKLQPTPLKIKVSKQQNEIDSLKAQLLKLQLENERLKSESQSNSITPKNEENEENQDLVKRNISFNESVNILDIDSQQNTKLNDKASIMRSNRNSTPYKPKSVKPIKSINTKQINMNNNKENKENQENIMIPTTNKQSRGSYRITPIPTRQGQRKITFKSRLQSINDNQELNKNKNKNNGQESRESSLNLSFNLGQPRLSTPSFLKGSTPSLSNNSSFVEDTPDINNIGADLTKTGSGASNFVSPILTPNNSKQNTKPFLFEWNKKK